jgi:ribonucleoside-diphosphate reductase alpha chain
MGVASGPVSFLKVFDAATEAIKQGGTRRGANMGILAVTHPDIEEFISLKADMRTLTNFNISVAVTDAFMLAVEADEEYDLTNPRNEARAGRRRARHIFDLIVANAWRTAIRVVFLDRINRDNPTPALGAIESTNPCGEQPLLPYESCNLGSINLSSLSATGSFNWSRLDQLTDPGIRFLDNCVDASVFPLPEVAGAARGSREDRSGAGAGRRARGPGTA